MYAFEYVYSHQKPACMHLNMCILLTCAGSHAYHKAACMHENQHMFICKYVCYDQTPLCMPLNVHTRTFMHI